ncbi:hypothetical protein ACFOLK_02215 [Marinococcus halophilus]|uniref:Uncharacterized protein n=1 Tax=Marinococcus halophilus TaxID=1371 RepID=A0A510Y683_MARHA|nr:hypothetical protein [Marinococcus halophilus]GEK58879.1 hypothetical protein MHA01_17840 [Marinococcus halophilus]
MAFQKLARTILKANRVSGDVKAAKNGSLGKRLARRSANRAARKFINRLLR